MRPVFRNLSLSGQLALSPIVASGSMLIVIVAGVVFGVAHGRVLSELELRLYPTRELVIEVEHDLLSFQQRLRGAVAAADVELLDEAGDRSSAMRSTLHDGIRGGLRPPAELAGVEELIARHLDVAMSVTKQLLADGKGGVSSEAFTDLDTSYHDVVEKLEIWKAHTGSQIQEAFGYSQQLRGRFSWAMVGVGLLATALMVWLARAIHRSISEPIGAVLDLADRAAEGDLKIVSLAATDLGRQSDAVPRLRGTATRTSRGRSAHMPVVSTKIAQGDARTGE